MSIKFSITTTEGIISSDNSYQEVSDFANSCSELGFYFVVYLSNIYPLRDFLDVSSYNTPLYTHDCDLCEFLGRYEVKGKVEDLYVHNTSDQQTVIARWSSEGSHYASGLWGSYRTHNSLMEARLRAEVKGHKFNKKGV